jgi:Transposase DDE domain
MRHNQSTLKASTVQAHAKALLLAQLELDNYKPSLPAGLVVSLLILASIWQTSLSAACSMVKDPPCRERARQAAHALLPRRPRDLLARLLRALWHTLPDYLRAGALPAAIDLHQRPLYSKRRVRGSTRRKKKAGTTNSFTYATLAVLSRWGRFSVALVATRPHMRLTTLVGELLKQAEQAGVAVSYLMMDKEFYAAEVVELLQKRCVAFLMPAEKRGGSKFLHEPATAVGFYDYGWTAYRYRYDAASRQRYRRGKLTVRVKGCAARHPVSGARLAFATWGLVGFSPTQVARTYRRRFGIEASYRQLNQCLARTSSTNERYRLLLVGMALLLCNLWSQLHAELFSTGARCETLLDLARLRLRQLACAVAAAVAALFGGYLDEWQTQRPLPPDLAFNIDDGNY